MAKRGGLDAVHRAMKQGLAGRGVREGGVTGTPGSSPE